MKALQSLETFTKLPVSHAFLLSFSLSLIFHFFCIFSSVFRSLNINICLRVLVLIQSSCSFTVYGPAYLEMMFCTQGATLQLPVLYTMATLAKISNPTWQFHIEGDMCSQPGFASSSFLMLLACPN